MLLFVAIFTIAGSFAQQFVQKTTFANPIHLTNAKTIDTLMAPVFYTTQACADTITYYSVGTGYLTGNAALNGQSILEVGQGFSATGSVSEVLALMTRVSGTASNISAKIYATAAGAFTPSGAALGTSSNVQISDIDNTNFQFVSFTFATPVAVSNNFTASIVLPTTTGDTVIIGGTRLGCIDATKDDRAVVNRGGSWITYKSITGTQGGSIDLYILTKINVAGGISESENSFTIFPNPANNFFVVNAKENINTLRVYNLVGNLVSENNDVNQKTTAVNTESLSNGSYFITIETAKGKTTQRFMIVK